MTTLSSSNIRLQFTRIFSSIFLNLLARITRTTIC